MHRFLIGIPIVLIAAGATAVRAESGLLAGLDANSDGVVTRAEFDAARRRDFGLLDRNGNKVISRKEFYRRGQAQDRALLALRQRRYRLMDVNDDGGITLAEYLAYGHKVFARMDRNRDRRLTVAEVATARGVQVASNDSGLDPAMPAQAEKAPARALGDMPFGTVDRNGDGYVSAAEYRRAVLVLFRRLDHNGNKVLSRHEYYWRGSANDKVRLAARKVAYRRADDDDDGGLTGAEFLKMSRGLFARIDRNKDHRLSRAEWVAAFGAPPETTTAKADPVKRGGKLRAVRSLRTHLVADATKVAPSARTAPSRAPAPRKAKAEKKAMPAKKATAARKPKTDDGTPNTALMAQMKAAQARKTKPKAAPKTDPQVASRPPAATASDKPKRSAINPRIAFAFRGLDSDHDGRISVFELKLGRMSRYNALDANRDRVLQANEFVGNRGAAAAARFREMDRDGNGLVTWEEYDAAGIQRFKQLDTNADQRLSLQEFANAGRVNNRNVRYVKRVKVPATRKAKRVDTRKSKVTTPFQFEVPSR